MAEGKLLHMVKGANTAPKRHSRDHVLSEDDPLYEAQGYAAGRPHTYTHRHEVEQG